jgi:hypothetical protein
MMIEIDPPYIKDMCGNNIGLVQSMKIDCPVARISSSFSDTAAAYYTGPAEGTIVLLVKPAVITQLKDEHVSIESQIPIPDDRPLVI